MTGLEDWQGRIGKEWAHRSVALDAMLEPVGTAAIEVLDVKPAEHVLDLGCGAGASSRALLARGASVTGVDVSPDLLAVAQQNDPDQQITWLLGDASAIRYPTPFDALFSRFGAMFFPQPLVAYAHLRFQMRSGARLVIVCWRDAEQNAWARVPLEAARPVLGEEQTALPPAGGQGPFGWAKAETFIDILRSTGWSSLSHAPLDICIPMGKARDGDPVENAVAFLLRVGPLASRLRGLPQTLKDAVARALMERLAKCPVRDGAVVLGSGAWVIEARA